MSRLLTMGVLLCVSGLAVEARSQARIGQECWLRYRVVDNVHDPASSVRWVVEVQLRAAQLDAEEGVVGWELVQLVVVELDAGAVVGEWSDVPALGTPDGLWWTAQDSLGRPIRGAYENPLMVQGDALPSRGAVGALAYAVVGTLPQNHALSFAPISWWGWLCKFLDCDPTDDEEVWVDVSLDGPSISY